MGSPVWELDGIICVGNIFKKRVKLVFNDGAALSDPDNSSMPDWRARSGGLSMSLKVIT